MRKTLTLELNNELNTKPEIFMLYFTTENMSRELCKYCTYWTL